MIPEEHKEDIIFNGIGFMRSITEAYGPDEGMKLWDTIATTLDPDIKGHIFFAMLTGDHQGVINVTGHHSSADRISLIKAVRTASGCGLKEAKDLCDDLTYNNKSFKINCDWRKKLYFLSELQKAGFIV